MYYPTPTPLPTPGAFECPAAFSVIDLIPGASITLGGHALNQGTVICIGVALLTVMALPPGLTRVTVVLTIATPSTTGVCPTGTTFAALTSVATGPTPTPLATPGTIGFCLEPVTWVDARAKKI